MKSYKERTDEILFKESEYNRNKKKTGIISCLSAFCFLMAVMVTAGPIVNLLMPAFTATPPTPQSPMHNGPEILSGNTSYTDVRDGITVLFENSKNYYDYTYGIPEAAPGAARPVGTAASADVAMPDDTASDSSRIEYSETNLQVVGVDEADIIKTDGNYIYALSYKNLHIVKVDNGQLSLASKISMFENDANYQNYTITVSIDDMMYSAYTYFGVSEMFLCGDRLITIGRSYNPEQNDNTYTTVKVNIYDITDRTAPRLVNTVEAPGNYGSSRMIGDKLYLVTNNRLYNNPGETNDVIEDYIPYVSVGGERIYNNPESVYINENPTNSYGLGYIALSGIDISGDVKLVSSKSLFGYSQQMYSSIYNMYITSQAYYNDVVNSDSGNNNNKTSYVETNILRFSLENGVVALRAKGSVDGVILNQFSMDEYDANFRIVTTLTDNITWNTSNALYVLDSELETVGCITDLAEGERVYSVRFDGKTGYFVTFRQTDPLFTVDLSVPTAPKIMSALKIPGFSNYLHPFADGLLFGFGMDADNNGRTSYLKLSMFDTSNPNDVTEKFKTVIDGEYYSEASYNHKAILINAEKNIIAFSGSNGSYYIYSYSDVFGFVKKATIDVGLNEGQPRGLFIGDVMYVYLRSGIYAYDITDNYKYIGMTELDNIKTDDASDTLVPAEGTIAVEDWQIPTP